MQNSLSGETLPQLKQTTYRIKSPIAMLADLTEIMHAVSPDLSTTDAVLADYLEAFVTYPCTGYACPLSADFAPSSDFFCSNYRPARLTTQQIHFITLST